MLDKTSHPFIFNTLQSSGKWSLDVSYFKSIDTWAVSTVFDDDRCHESTTVATGSTAQEALDRLESVLSGREDALKGRGAELAGREYVTTKPRDPEREAYLARWEDAPEWANFITQDGSGENKFWEHAPELHYGVWMPTFAAGKWVCFEGADVLGSVHCEPRPSL